MKLKTKITLLVVGFVSMSGFLFAPMQSASAASGCPKTSVLSGVCKTDSGEGDVDGKATIMGILLIAINILTVGVGIAAVGGIVWAAILYTTAEDKPAQVSQAKTIITNVVIGIVAYFLMYSLLQFIVPGGIFNQ